MSNSVLFSPLRIGGLTAKNRVMQLSTTTNLHDRLCVTDAMLAFYEERAKGGVGSIVMEPMTSPKPAHGKATTFTRSNLGLLDQQTIEGLKRLGDAIHRHGVLIFGQINHGGRQHHATTLPLLYGPSAIPCPQSGGVPHRLDHDEIETTVQGFVEAAVSLQESGFDGVEVHGAQGHLVQEFLSPFSNQRTDEYGGSLDNRLRFLRQILHRIHAACGDDFVIGLRLATEERSPNGIDLGEACKIVRDIEATAKLDYLSLSVGNFNSIELHIPDRSFPQVNSMDDAEEIKKVVPNTPVVVCGRIITPENAERIISKGQADLIGLCRPLISDPEWPIKAAEGRTDEIRYCISCNQCWAEITSARPVRCIHNASAGRELEWGLGTLKAARVAKRVIVIGGGPAGMEAARVAAIQGHTVVLFDQARTLGGAVGLAAGVPGHGEVGYVRDYLADAIKRVGVEVRLGPAARVSAERVLDEMPDVVIVATGALPSRSSLGAPEGFPVYTTHDVVGDRVPTGNRAVLFDEDGYYEGCETAEMVAHQGTDLYVVSRFTEIGREIPKTARISALRELDELGATLVPTAWYSRTDGRNVYLAHYYTNREWVIEEVDCLIHVGGKSSVDNLYQELKSQVPIIHLIGDAYMPRRIMDAVREGHEVGRGI